MGNERITVHLLNGLRVSFNIKAIWTISECEDGTTAMWVAEEVDGVQILESFDEVLKLIRQVSGFYTPTLNELEGRN